MPLEIYGMALSAPVRICMMTAELTGTECELKEVNLMKGEHMTPEYLKMNPQHNIPTMKDGDFVMNESRAIATYIASKYGGEKIYPADPQVRGKIDQRLYFDMGTFYKAFGDIIYPKAMDGIDATDKQRERFKEVLGWVNDMVKETGYAAGTDHLTLADVAFLATYSSVKATEHFDLDEYTALNEWFEKVQKEIPNYEKNNGEGAAVFGGWIKDAMSKK